MPSSNLQNLRSQSEDFIVAPQVFLRSGNYWVMMKTLIMQAYLLQHIRVCHILVLLYIKNSAAACEEIWGNEISYSSDDAYQIL